MEASRPFVDTGIDLFLFTFASFLIKYHSRIYRGRFRNSTRRVARKSSYKGEPPYTYLFTVMYYLVLYSVRSILLMLGLYLHLILISIKNILLWSW